MINSPLPRIDLDEDLQNLLLRYCRLDRGEIWKDPNGKHRVGCFDVNNKSKQKLLMCNEKALLAIQDPPYNFIAFGKKNLEKFTDWCMKWVKLTYEQLDENSSMYVWLGADQSSHFKPLPQFMSMMEIVADGGFESKNFITMRNQRGYGTQKNWMSIRQELLYYIKGNPSFNVEADYTDIPKILKGYYKEVSGKKTDNFERSKSEYIRAGNVWVDLQQVFYRMEENVNGCFAQKPLKSIERIIRASSNENDLVIDFFAHSGTTLLACEILNRKCYTSDIDPVYCEITIRRLERLRETGKTGWQNSNPFYHEILKDSKLRKYLCERYNTTFSSERIKNDL